MELVEIIGNIDRPNISYSVMTKSKLEIDIGQIFADVTSEQYSATLYPTVLYWDDKSKCTSLFHKIRDLRNSGSTENKVFLYTADICDKSKDGIIKSVKKGTDTKVIIATNALGLGVDIPNGRRVIHLQVPQSFNDLVQAMGRGGRDGLPSIHTLFINSKGLVELLEPHNASVKYSSRDRDIKVYSDYVSGLMCRRKIILDYYVTSNESMEPSALCCDVCTNSSMVLAGVSLKREVTEVRDSTTTKRQKSRTKYPLSMESRILMLNSLSLSRIPFIVGHGIMFSSQYGMQLAEVIAADAYSIGLNFA
ncbi:P-loop containing nucleoside triphosphate hydrolase protein [Rhizoclosmatium globosum]|uniref:DNA 3'-5' helicase n=1 Tax=Rhizoclosmatium globosum TaxID=329046 RepID=A0A1Y2A4T7_9FUNG|nr:P-loop containing nucleoside triphosphate hydrolase protein [Rhizoclosmatium globosum]|eukprot:ORY17045.1 P-loop containing nucleoside triphosphate hydrolase protein [Rhizoclosmatium globosum]